MGWIVMGWVGLLWVLRWLVLVDGGDGKELGFEKKAWRSRLLGQRRSLSVEQWRLGSRRIGDQLRQLPLFQRSRTVLAYCSYRQEPDLRWLWDGDCLTDSDCLTDKVWGLPRCEGKTLIWHRWVGAAGLESGAFGILEPRSTTPLIASTAVDLLLVPCVGADRRGYRLGYGGGFYDRLLADPVWCQIPTIGITFDFALVEQLPTEQWDLPLANILTDQQLIVRSAG
jgi:5-formyltetrahydrofolate cyclo-ligase